MGEENGIKNSWNTRNFKFKKQNIRFENLKKIFLDLRPKTLLVTLHPTTLNFNNIGKEVIVS